MRCSIRAECPTFTWLETRSNRWYLTILLIIHSTRSRTLIMANETFRDPFETPTENDAVQNTPGSSCEVAFLRRPLHSHRRSYFPQHRDEALLQRTKEIRSGIRSALCNKILRQRRWFGVYRNLHPISPHQESATNSRQIGLSRPESDLQHSCNARFPNLSVLPSQRTASVWPIVGG
jgi:hypothetical protein